MSPALPPALRPWAAHLSSLDPAAARTLGAWMPRLAAALGPLHAAPEASVDGEPDGYDGLARRGPWGRLLTTEWALATVAPLELVRRTSEGEASFLRLARRKARPRRRSLILLDAGPEQLGLPRLVQLAAWVVLGARADEAGWPMAWGVVQDRTRSWRTLQGEEGLRLLLRSRAEREADAEDLDAWLDDVGPDDEIWCLGPPGARREGLRRLAIQQVDEAGGARLRVDVEGRRARLLLDPPPGPVAASLLSGRLRASGVSALGDLPRVRWTDDSDGLIAVTERTVALWCPDAEGRWQRRAMLDLPVAGEIAGVSAWAGAPVAWRREGLRYTLHVGAEAAEAWGDATRVDVPAADGVPSLASDGWLGLLTDEVQPVGAPRRAVLWRDGQGALYCADLLAGRVDRVSRTADGLHLDASGWRAVRRDDDGARDLVRRLHRGLTGDGVVPALADLVVAGPPQALPTGPAGARRVGLHHPGWTDLLTLPSDAPDRWFVVLAGHDGMQDRDVVVPDGAEVLGAFHMAPEASGERPPSIEDVWVLCIDAGRRGLLAVRSFAERVRLCRLEAEVASAVLRPDGLEVALVLADRRVLRVGLPSGDLLQFLPVGVFR